MNQFNHKTRCRGATLFTPGLLLAVVCLGCSTPAPNTPQPHREPGQKDRLLPEELRRIEVFRRACPSIVHIESLNVRRDPTHFNVIEIPLGMGSGFVWDTKGHVVTNLHVIRDGEEARVSFKDGSSSIARVMGTDTTCDVAVLMVDASRGTLVPIQVDRSVAPEVGQSVLAIGNPFGLDHTLTVGVVSALGRDLREESGVLIQGVIQVDAAINPGNSGGPLLDSSGRLLGLNTALVSPSGAFAGIGFAVPVSSVDAAVSRILGIVPARRPGLGVRVADDSWTRELELRGVLIMEVRPGSGADLAGMRATRTTSSGDLELGDVITAVAGKPVGSCQDLLDALADRREGEHVAVTVLRAGERQDLSIVLMLEDH